MPETRFCKPSTLDPTSTFEPCRHGEAIGIHRPIASAARWKRAGLDGGKPCVITVALAPYRGLCFRWRQRWATRGGRPWDDVGATPSIPSPVRKWAEGSGRTLAMVPGEHALPFGHLGLNANPCGTVESRHLRVAFAADGIPFTRLVSFSRIDLPRPYCENPSRTTHAAPATNGAAFPATSRSA